MPEQPKPLSEASSPARPAFCGNSIGVRVDGSAQITQIVQCLDVVDVRVLDHFIVGGNGVISFAERGLL
jgi:hypothetical protein